MGVFEMIVLVTFIATIGKVAQTAFARQGADPGSDRVKALEAALRANDARLAQTEEKVVELTEKLDFMENLLAKPGRAPQLPGSAEGGVS